MTGYQGWFNTPGDGAGLGWTHWGRGKGKPFAPGSVTVDLWPDMSELDDDEKYETGFTHKNGEPAYVFSSHNKKTVIRHFEWMRDYGIDGAFVQRFAHGLRREESKHHKNVVLSNAREGANRAGRSYAVMYDLTGLPKGGTELVKQDWKELKKKMRITKDPAYQSHNGKPLVAVWGIGFNDKIKPRKYTLEECSDLVRFLKRNGCSVMLGVPTGWRTLDRDAVSTKDLHALLEKVDVVSPWTPGRYKRLDQVAGHAEKYWAPDVDWCEERKPDFLPVVFPGFSWHNMKGTELGAIPRLKGQFFWEQLMQAKQSGVKMIYVAMFDEVDEGTAIFKCTNEPPTGNGGKFLTYEGLPSDYYLYLTGQAGRILRDEIPVCKMAPVRDGIDTPGEPKASAR
ncbi:glycoside hydrolase family 71/99-like protein [Pelagicoccus mobilis]